jgi:hypothetical protein
MRVWRDWMIRFNHIRRPFQERPCDRWSWWSWPSNSRIDAFKARCGPLTTLVNAGLLSAPGAIDPLTTTFEDWRRIFATNVEGVF